MSEGRIKDKNVLPLSIKNRHIKSLSADKITAGTVIVQIPIGEGGSGGYILLDGSNNRIIVHDGTHNRVIIGFQEDGF